MNRTKPLFTSWITLLLIGWLVLPAAQAQENTPPFWDEIQAFKQQDSRQMPPKNAVLFVGSSSLRMWKDMQEMLPGYTVINRGFGGSNLLDLNRYLPDIVYPYQPKQIVIYSGENDIASDTVQAPEVLARFKDVFQRIRQEMPGVPVVFISIKPSPSRWHYKPIIVEANQQIRKYLKSQPKTQYVDVYRPMLNAGKRPKPEIFIQDSLHMNNKGYEIWAKTLTPYLLK
ncbi:GDSL-type esterase/lipase family protein [Pontibacter sp. E15-1]|uniref:GDSL-type esterase/lipase family protein n=1 Tax=Pontibacter sp. E15-1 TaxID=2919918 RepID=UPI001F4F81F0|nr:GDSL-type esterase/lipase family protein [Pontibacter sp. E15-1]MCJ8166768.1 GDSL-type esterase/lipase family protein [Pontibacter sp. E15-1]